MAAYEKQQPQQQPQPQLNAAYYGPPIPPQPAYYGPPPAAPRRRGPRCFLFMVVALVVIALGTASLVLWLIFRPDTPKAYADSAALSRFDLGAGSGINGGDLLQYNLTVNIRLRNPNRFGIHYDYAEAHASYDDDRFGFHAVQPFYLDSKSDGRITTTFSGSSVMTDDDVRRTYRRERTDGFFYVKVKVYSDLRFKVRVFNVHDKSKITCVLRLPVPAAGDANSTAMTTLGTRCDVDF
ncbi:NDR1/HIN1-like protein 10 [Phragmites australis]|uniref:NDR1/HIN1-like protein 10 n=1 Tax=Phragmites australis TaxID=29695 RepID=UPI002D768299|nr:NDR1/HIN1-like protein 10 [Phragmites australis]